VEGHQAESADEPVLQAIRRRDRILAGSRFQGSENTSIPADDEASSGPNVRAEFTRKPPMRRGPLSVAITTTAIAYPQPEQRPFRDRATAGTLADHQRHRERIANGRVRDVVVYTGCVTTLTCDDAISPSCIANDPLVAYVRMPCPNAS
jgi:hypothetical protein